jgi:hypothetical protein
MASGKAILGSHRFQAVNRVGQNPGGSMPSALARPG